MNVQIQFYQAIVLNGQEFDVSLLGSGGKDRSDHLGISIYPKADETGEWSEYVHLTADELANLVMTHVRIREHSTSR